MWIALLTLFVGCDFSSDPNDYLKIKEVRTQLAFDIPSYSNFEEVKEFLNLRDDQVIVLEDNKILRTSYRPQFNVFTIKIENLSIEGYQGDLRLSFLNDRLQATWFYPEDVKNFLDLLNLDRTALESRQGVMKKPFTRMWIYKDFQDKTYVGWEDVRLTQQNMDWITRYS